MMATYKKVEVCTNAEETAFQNIESICIEWRQHGMVLPHVERAIWDKDAAGIQHAICACYMPFDDGDLDLVWPDSDIDRQFTEIRRNLKVIRDSRSLKIKAMRHESICEN